MHKGDSTIRVPVDVGIEATGCATRDGQPSPQQRFVPVDRSRLKPGDILMNAGTLKLHLVVTVTDDGVTLQTDDGPITFGWQDAQAAAWQVLEA